MTGPDSGGEAHNHVTRDIKAPGKCPGCDAFHARHAPAPTVPDDAGLREIDRAALGRCLAVADETEREAYLAGAVRALLAERDKAAGQVAAVRDAVREASNCGAVHAVRRALGDPS